MDKRNFDKDSNIREQRYVLSKKLTICSMGINLVLAVGLVMSINREKIILVPQVAPEMKMFVTQSQVSNGYLSVLSRNVLDLLLNVTPNNVDAQHQELLRMVASKYRDRLNGVLGNISKQITQGNISQQFYIESIRVVLDSNVVYVDGILNEYIDKNLSNSVAQMYRLTYHIQNYGAQLDNIELVAKDDPQLKDLKNVK